MLLCSPTSAFLGAACAACRFKPLAACQPGRALPQSILQALLPAPASPAASSPSPQRQQQQQEQAAEEQQEQGIQQPGDDEEGTEEEQELREQQRLVAAHPQLLLLLEHSSLQRCGTCTTCTAERQQGHRACLISQRCQNLWQLQRQRQLQGGRSSATGSDSNKATGKREYNAAGSRLPTSTGVAEGDALRAAVAFKLLHPRWRPIFLTPALMAEAEAALPLAAAAAAADHARRGVKSLHFSAKQRARMDELLSLLRGDSDDASNPSPLQQPEQQRQEQQQELEQEQEQEEHPDSSRHHRQQAAREQAALQEGQQAQQQQPALPGHVAGSSAFRSLPGAPAAVTRAPDPEQRQLQQLRRQLRQLPADVRLAFEAGLAAGLPPAAVAAALARYHTITAVPAAATEEAEGGKATVAAGKPRRRGARFSSSRSDSGSPSSEGGQDVDEEEQPAEVASPAQATRAKRQRRQ
jgi:hypothetical protein